MENFAELKEAIERVELVDAHAHNIRSIREISHLYGCEPSLDGVEKFRRLSGLESITETCFKASRISVLLIDDGLELDKKVDIEWHKNFVPSVGRLLRIERLAEKILDEEKPAGANWTLDSFTSTFVEKLNFFFFFPFEHGLLLNSLSFITLSEEVVGYKSIAAYRSGLDINTKVTMLEAENGLHDVLQGGSPIRITNKNFIDHVFTCALEVALIFDLPIQIHTGFGDKDLDLRLANPLHLRNVLEDKRFSKSRIVLLHASYPFSKEASYLALVYPQVYLDFGLAIPKLSFHGMMTSLKELLSLAPIRKVMFSTDGYAFPETFFLGAKKAQEVVFAVLRDLCMEGDLSIQDALSAVKDIFSENAKGFYKIKVAEMPVESEASSPFSLLPVESPTHNCDLTLVRIIWVDASGQQRCRVVPEKRFHDVVVKNGVGLTHACMAMTSAVDGPADGTNLTGVGEIRLIPDLSTKYRIPWAKQQEMVLADMHLTPGEAWEYCPREALRRVSKVLKDEFNLVMNAGFENEFVLLKNIAREGKEEWVPFDTRPYCSTSAFDEAFPVLHEVIASLQSLNISAEQVHAEAGNGQYEIALQYTICTKAADNLVYTREVIRSVARRHGLLATFVPKYALDDIGSGNHVHISLSENGKNVFMANDESAEHGMSKVGEEFMAGVLDHLPSILVFTAPIPNSYDRIQPNTWSGAYLCWGKENREAPLRTACPPGVPNGAVSNFEIKVCDGCSNPYLALASIIIAGIDGLRQHLSLPKPVDENPDNRKEEIQRLPKSLSESLEALEKDTLMHELMGEKLLTAIKGVRKAEIKYYAENKDAYRKMIHRY
ncbi:OLC1v1034439C1 [Oldenlandia corymbosa var. corymbosa]|uniref:OLC1v1034439C1 n=1 Tax=Oldenlandia corymbosa var. corymbosa TaxID=529605 RepID=A0AAV1CSA2_OLDCO|nr:OLC1v1034439C1 [Oldenlandia corymbosa var. corymbosa]